MIETAPQLLTNALALGSIYALAALGFVLVINAVGAVNFAHGELVMLGGFVAVGLTAVSGPLPGLALLPVAMATMAAAGVVLALVAYAPLRRAPPVSVFISTIAVGLIIQHTVTSGVGPEPRVGPSLVGVGAVELLGLAVSRQQFAIVAVAGVLLFAVHTLLKHTRFGRRLRAAAQDPVMARAIGIPVALTTAASFAMAGALAGAAGMMLSHQYFVTPTDGALLMLKAYIATVIGGWGRVWGAALGAIAIAVFETVVAVTVSYLVAEALLYIGVLALLMLRPQGMFGEAEGRRA